MRRAVGVLVAVVPAALAIASLIAAGRVRAPLPHVGAVVIGLACFVAAVNAFTSWVRPLVHFVRHRSREGYRHVSGIPVIGSMLGVLGVLLAFGSTWGASAGLGAALLDTGSVTWFVIATWNDRSLWDAGGAAPGTK